MSTEQDAKDMYFYREKCRYLEAKEKELNAKLLDFEEAVRHYSDARNYVRLVTSVGVPREQRIEWATDVALGVLKKWQK